MRARPDLSKKQPTARDTSSPANHFRVTHPFHPLFGQEFELVDSRRTWGEDRVYFLDTQGELKRLPASWTSAAAFDPFLAVSAGRAAFRVDDLVELAIMIERHEQAEPGPRERKKRRSVKQMTPKL